MVDIRFTLVSALGTEMYMLPAKVEAHARASISLDEARSPEFLATQARAFLSLALKKLRRDMRGKVIYCRVDLATDATELKLRKGVVLLIVYPDRTETYRPELKTCVHCGWRDTTDYNITPGAAFYCSNSECRLVRENDMAQRMADSLQSKHDKGICGFQPYYRPTCTNPSISREEPYCTEHQGVRCVVCKRQAIGEVGYSGSLNNYWPVCLEHEIAEIYR